MGLLDLMNSDAGMVLAAGLLDAGAAKPVRTGTMQGIAQSLLGAQQYKQAQEDRAFRQKQLQAQLEEQQAQAQARREQAQMLQNRQKLLGAMDPNAGPPAQVSIPQALANGISLQEMAAMTPQARQPEYKVVGGALVRIDGDGVKEAYRQPDKPELNQLIVQGPDGKPMINDLLLRAKTQIASSGAARTNVSLGSPVPVTMPDGSQALVQPANKPGEPPQIMRLPGTGEALRPAPDANTRKASLENRTAMAKIDAAIDAVTRAPNAFGLKNAMGDTVMQRLDPAGVEARALVADIGSQKINDRSGAAVSAAEFPRLQPFIPNATDTAATVQKKLKQFKIERQRLQSELDGGALISDVSAKSSSGASLEDLLKKYGN